MNNFKAMQETHMALLARQDDGPADPALLRDVQAFMSQATANSTWVADPSDRDLLRAYLRYWASFVYERTGAYPRTELRPAEPSALSAEPPRPVYEPETAAPVAPRRAFPWLPLLAGLIGLGLLAAAFLLVLPSIREPAPGPDVQPPPATIAPTLTVAPPDSLPFAPIDERNAAGLTRAFTTAAHTGPALALAFAPRGGELASGGADGMVRFWAVPDLQLIDSFTDQNSWVRAVAYVPPSSAAAAAPRPLTGAAPFLTGGNDRIVRLYDRNSLQLFSRFSEIGGFVFSAVFSPGGRLVAAGGGDGITHIWDAATGRETQALLARGTEAVVTSVAFSPDGAQLATGVSAPNNAGGLQLWNARSGEWICNISGASITALAYQPDGEIIAVGSDAGELFFIEADDCEIEDSVRGHGGAVGGIAYSPAGDWLVSGGGDGSVKVWSAGGELLATPVESGPIIEAVAVNPTAQFIAAANADGQIALWGVRR